MRRNEYEENVVDEEDAQQDGADLEARQTEHLQHVDAKKEETLLKSKLFPQLKLAVLSPEEYSQNVLQHPGPVLVPEHDPDRGEGHAQQ